jgi:serine/threonine protein kinase
MTRKAPSFKPEASREPLRPESATHAEPPPSQGLVDVAYHEFCRTRERGESLDPDGFCARFPEVKSSLARLIQHHLFLEENLYLLGEARPRWPEPGESFLGYVLLGELGKGSFARVFLAQEPMLGNRLVAVKVARGGAAEALILGRLRHPNIVPVYSVQQDAGTGLSVVCMPYLGSATLCDVLDRAFAHGARPTSAQVIVAAIQSATPPPESETPKPWRFMHRATYVDGIRLIAAQLAEALAFIHARGICHRDLKPSNVLMSPSGTPMLLDFNLSADAGEQHKRLGGTLPYMSPEQLLATDQERPCDPSLLDARSDLFSLGVILFELLTGRHPFGPISLDLKTQEVRKQLLERQRSGALALREANPAVDRPLARLVERCLQYNPNERPQTAAGVAAELRKGLSPWRRTVRWLARRPRSLAAAILLCLIFCASSAYLVSLRPPYAERQLARGVALYHQGEYKEALHHFDRALDAEPSLFQARFARGRACQRLGQADSRYLNLAIADYQAAEDLQPCGKTKACLGYCHNLIGQPQAAVKYYCLAVSAGWATPEVFNNLGYSYFRQHNLDDAKRTLDQALARSPHLQAALYNRAVVALKRAQSHAQFPADRTKVPKGHRAAKDEQILADLADCLRGGIADMQQAIAQGPATAFLYYDAACLCALASRHDPRWRAQGLDYLSQAIAGGIDPKRLAGDALLSALSEDSRFLELLRTPCSRPPPTPTLPILDPVEGIPD